MITAFVLLKVDYPHLNEIAEQLAALDDVSEVCAVAGEEDLLVVVRGKDNHAVAEVVTNRIVKTPGVTACRTKIALRSYKGPGA